MHSDSPSQTSSSIANSDSEAEKPAESSNGTGVAVTKDPPPLVKLTSKDPESGMQANGQQIQSSSIPYKGRPDTRNRNQRRRETNKLRHLKRIGLLPEKTTMFDFRRLKGDEIRANGVPEELRKDSQINVIRPDADFELRRDALLEAITSGGLEVSRDPGLEDDSTSANIEAGSINCHAASTEDVENQIVEDLSKIMQDVEQSANQEPDATTVVTEPPPVSGQTSLGSPQRRSKLDLASSRRLLFGSLGLPTPKNEQDERNIRERLMKDVKRKRPSESQVEAGADESLTVRETEENEQWEDKIVLKAVECCYDGIELSTPPFPFVQRWDPQQQGGYGGLKKGRNFRKSKRRKRNDEQFYQQVPIDTLEDGNTHANTVALETEEHIHENFLPPRVEQQLQQQIGLRKESDEYEVAIKDQLMRETDASVSASAENGTIQDLPMLPEDMSTCTPLRREAFLPGAIVAFKQLDMSQETNWQPAVSDYRTALVERLMENGIIRMTLAQRDQPQVQKSYNQHTGERIYSKFEMPGYDDKSENGIVELSFAELIDPKLIRVASVEPLRMDDQQCSGRGAGLPKELVTEEHIDKNLMDYNRPNPKLLNSSVNGSETDRGREEVRKEVFDLIKDAGWRSSIRSDIDQERGHEENLSLSDQADDRRQELVDPISPKFLGFSSSPPTGGWVGARSEMSQTTSVKSDPLSSPQTANILEVAESLPFQRITGPESPLKRMSSYVDEDLDLKAEDEEVGDEPRPKPTLPEAYNQVSSQLLGTSKSPYQSIPSDTRDFQHDPPTKELISTGGTDSDDFPMTEDIFSQIKSREPSSVEMEDSTYVGSSSFETLTSKDEPLPIPEVRKVKPYGKENLSKKQTLFKWGESEEDEDQTTPHASQVPLQSQIVDLTLSSDPADAADSDYVDYGTQLPSGPGWVKKKKASGQHFNTVETDNRRSRRTRSTSSRAFN